MGKKKKGSKSDVALIGIAVVAGFLMSIPKEVWYFLGVVGALAFIAKLVAYFSKTGQKSDWTSATHQADAVAERPSESSWSIGTAASPSHHSTRNDPLPVVVSESALTSSGKRIPTAPPTFGPGRWIQQNESVEVAGFKISGGLIYVGNTLVTGHGGNDPCLIDPAQRVASDGRFTSPLSGYWPSYSGINPSDRHAYLSWLAEGRKSPDADIGYVFLYFYGLERRTVIDGSKEPTARADWPTIALELRRLLAIYGEGSHSFHRYASDLLNWVELANYSGTLYQIPVPELPKTWEVPLYLKVAIGQAMVDKAPIPAQLAFAWVQHDPNTSLRTPATRCPDEFQQLFVQRYTQHFDPGLVIPVNKTKLKFVYKPASSALYGKRDITLTYGDLPDATALTKPIADLKKIADLACEDLDAYSRYLGRNPGQNASLDALLLLPHSVWPAQVKKKLHAFKDKFEDGIVTLPLTELLDAFEASSTVAKDKLVGLAKVLESLGIGIEPDVIGGAKPPKADGNIVLFATHDAEPLQRTSIAYQTALFTLQTASAIAAADGDFSKAEVAHLRAQIEAWAHLSTPHRERLFAHLRLLQDTPIGLLSLKQKLAPLPPASKEAIASFMATVAQADGDVSPAEIKTLEKVYKALDVDPKRVFSDLHTAASAGNETNKTTATSGESGFKLDAARIAALQQDTERVSALLSNIFVDETPPTPPSIEPPPDDTAEQQTEQGFLGLDIAHSALARLLLTRSEWSRADLNDVAADLDLMLDGALEQINEAAFDAYDLPLTEGDDPIEVNTALLEKLEA